MSRCVIIPLLSLSAFLLAHPIAVVAIEAERSLQDQAEDVAARLEGVMDTSAQAAANPKAPRVQMTTCRVQVTDAATTDSPIFLYQEQAMADTVGKPYRQRFLHITPSRYSKMVQSVSFKPAAPASWIGLCSKPEVDRRLQTRALGQVVCRVFLRRSGNDYIGDTPADGCPANVRGAVRIKNHIVLYPNGMDTRDRGFDAKGQQVWGAKSDAYEFRKLQHSPN